jgi:beta-mannosidase
MVIPWQLHESYPNAWCTSSVDYRGDAKPAYHAVARAFRTERVSIRTERAVWAGEDTARATAWVWSERGVDASEVVLRLRHSDGTTVSEARRTLDGVSRPVEALALEVPLTGLSATGSEVFVWEAEWRAGDAVVDREVSLASAGADWSALLDLPPATLDLDVTVEPAAAGLASSGPAATGPAGSGPAITGPAGSGPTGSDSRLADNWLVRIRHLSGPLVVGLTLTDARAADSAGHSTISGDPRALLPGEDRTYRVHWDARIPLHERTLRLDAWNAGVHRIDAQISTSTSTMTETDAS